MREVSVCLTDRAGLQWGRRLLALQVSKPAAGGNS